MILTIYLIIKIKYKHYKNTLFVKNKYHGACGAVKTGLKASDTNAIIVYQLTI